MEIVDRIRPIREAEGLSQEDFAVDVGLRYQTLRMYETGRTKSIGSEQLSKITGHPRYKKYALWLVTGEAAPESGQISPEIEQERDVG
ncbi:MAG: transcriptional regulator [SAR86 cluster bacterium]|uniref:Transcriptional regulator n=1 Tax=SAR86 cluster bacterium TaxID=2030880 RepID=A0A2A5ATS7_9GAMM|nr:MAG: transcriptional regulator [SAR86 cluster bacterium]